MQLVEIFVVKSVLVSLLARLCDSLLYDRGGRWRLFRDDPVLAEDVIPRSSVNRQGLLASGGRYHSVSAFGLSTGTFIGMSIFEEFVDNGRSNMSNSKAHYPDEISLP